MDIAFGLTAQAREMLIKGHRLVKMRWVVEVGVAEWRMSAQQRFTASEHEIVRDAWSCFLFSEFTYHYSIQAPCPMINMVFEERGDVFRLFEKAESYMQLLSTMQVKINSSASVVDSNMVHEASYSCHLHSLIFASSLVAKSASSLIILGRHM